MQDDRQQFDGVEYPGGRASDPRSHGWMQGAPPSVGKRIRFEDDRLLEFPQIRWSLSHVRELVPTAAVWRGAYAPSELGAVAASAEADIDLLEFDDLSGRRHTWAEALQHTYTDGILILHRGRRVYERYFGELLPQRPHASFSITKSYAGTLAAALLHEGVLDGAKLTSYYIPEMAGTAYADASLRQILDMQVGVAYSEDYADPRAEIWQYGRAGGLRPRGADYSGPTNHYDFLMQLRKQGEHGAAFDYKTVNTEVLCWIMARTTGVPFPQLLSERIWSQIGCEEDGYVLVDSIGVAMGGAGLNATLRDMARFGELMRCEGSCRNKQILPPQVSADIQRGADRAKFAAAGYELLAGYSYRNMWWVSHGALDVFEGRGIYGQRLWIAPKSELVIARFASHPVAASAANDPITLPAFAAVSRLVTGR